MKLPGQSFDASEPPGGDFARYIEKLNALAAAQAEREAAARAQAPRPGPVQEPANRSPAAPRQPAAPWPPMPALSRRMRRTAAWMIGAGIALVLIAVLGDDPLSDTMLPGVMLIGAGLAFRRHFGKR